MAALTAVDLFAGAGGATQGLRDAGFEVLGAVESDPTAAASYALNHPTVRVWESDVRCLPAAEMARELMLQPRDLTLLKACPPCQGFSSLAEGRSPADELQNDLVHDVVRFVRVLRPAVVLIENVPGLGRDRRSTRFVETLSRLGYSTSDYYVNAIDFGVPQRRKRYIILAVRGTRQRLPDDLRAISASPRPPTVRTTFVDLARCAETDDLLNKPRSTNALVAERIAAIPKEGNRFDLPPHLTLACHAKLPKKRDATSAYGRMSWDGPSPTMTTRCTSVSCGSFIHPEENRGITLREAAALQTFPSTYKFSGSYAQVERQIGNAVPVVMARELGLHVKKIVGEQVVSI